MIRASKYVLASTHQGQLFDGNFVIDYDDKDCILVYCRVCDVTYRGTSRKRANFWMLDHFCSES